MNSIQRRSLVATPSNGKVEQILQEAQGIGISSGRPSIAKSMQGNEMDPPIGPNPGNGLIPERELGAFGRLPTRDLTSLPAFRNAMAECLPTILKMFTALAIRLSCPPGYKMQGAKPVLPYAKPYKDSQITCVSLRPESKNIMTRTPKWSRWATSPLSLSLACILRVTSMFLPRVSIEIALTIGRTPGLTMNPITLSSVRNRSMSL
jgi:hypothetical protein